MVSTSRSGSASLGSKPIICDLKYFQNCQNCSRTPVAFFAIFTFSTLVLFWINKMSRDLDNFLHPCLDGIVGTRDPGGIATLRLKSSRRRVWLRILKFMLNCRNCNLSKWWHEKKGLAGDPEGHVKLSHYIGIIQCNITLQRWKSGLRGDVNISDGLYLYIYSQ